MASSKMSGLDGALIMQSGHGPTSTTAQNTHLATEKSELHDDPESSPSIDSLSWDRRHGDTYASSPSTYYQTLKENHNSLVGIWKSRAMKIYQLQNIPDLSEQHPRPWKKTLVRFGPLSGIFCMILAIASIFASLGILAGSDHQRVANWPTPPATYLAIFTAIANQSVRYAEVQGVIITWWIRASHGSTISQLHRDWRSGLTLRGALTAGHHMGLLGLACIFSLVVVIDGPLLQRSSTVISAQYHKQPVPLNISMVPELPREINGYWLTSAELGDPSLLWWPAFNKTVPTSHGSAPNNIWANLNSLGDYVTGQWEANNPLRGVVRGCRDACEVKLHAPALFPTSCTTHLLPLNLKTEVDVKAIFTGQGAAPLDHEVFLIDASLVFLEEREVINLITAFATTTDDCEGTLNYTICTLESGIGLYEFQIDGDEISLLQLGPPTLVALANNTSVDRSIVKNQDAHPSTLANVIAAAYDIWQVSQIYFANEEGVLQGETTGSGEFQRYIVLNNNSESCPSFRDPRDDVMNSLNKFMLYTGAHLATQNDSLIKPLIDPDLLIHYSVEGYREGQHSVFHTDYWYFLGAAILELVCLALILPTYWGWWRMGRAVSFSPLELAMAFESPMLSDCNSNSTSRDLARAKLDIPIKYGVTSAHEGGGKTKLAFREPSSVTMPQENMEFDC